MNRAALLGAAPLCVLLASCGGVPPKPDVRPADVALSRDTIAALIQQPPGLVAVVRCVLVEHESEGMRSERTSVRAEVVDVARGEARGTIELWHYGPPRMDQGRTYVVAAMSAPDNTLLEAIPIRAADAEAVLARVRTQVH